MTLPFWILDSLLHWIDALQAEEVQAAALAGSLPWLQPYERRRITRAWDKAMQRARRDETIKNVEVVVEDPEQARQWFEQRGARIEGGRKP